MPPQSLLADEEFPQHTGVVKAMGGSQDILQLAAVHDKMRQYWR